MKKLYLHVLALVVLLPLGSLSAHADLNRVQSLRLAIEDLQHTWGSAYARAPEYLSHLKRIENKLSRSQASEGEELEQALNDLQRQALLNHPLLRRQPLLFVVRHQYKKDHHNTATMFQNREINTQSFQGGGALKVLDTRTGQVRTLLELKEGVLRDPEMHFDGTRFVFAMRREIKDEYHIYEMNVDGSNLRQLTFGAELADIDPFYLADDRIGFTSTREPKYCMCNVHIMGNLFVMNPDGSGIHQIDRNTLHSGHGVLMPDGRILYDRWEYVDRNFGDAQGLWTVNPDGTNHALFWGNNSGSPGGVIDARMIPGTEWALCIFGSCHDRPWGALTVIDRRLGLDGRQAVVHMWPSDAINLVESQSNNNWDAFMKVRPKYEDPYPLNDTTFLCARMTGNKEQMGIYLLDTFGNEILIHTEGPGCYDPTPLGPRMRPDIVPPRRDFQTEPGYFYIHDVYEGTHMQGVKPGSVKYLRVVESPPKEAWTVPSWGGQGVHRPAMNWHGFENKRILGTVPVEPDGSVYVEVPSDRFVYFQLLDDEGLMIQSMRSGTMVQSGEKTGCVGCHEHRLAAPRVAQGTTLQALQKPVQRLSSGDGHNRTFSFMTDVQPILNRHCLSCHDFGGEGAEKLVLAPDRTNTFNVAYNELWRKGYTGAIGAGPAQTQPAYSWGSHASKLIETIRKGHHEVRLTAQELTHLATWVDINAVYYPTYASAYADNLSGRCPLTNQELKRLTELTGVPFTKLARHNSNRGPQVTYDRPDLSPCLRSFTNHADPNYVEALALIQTGRDRLMQQSRADMPGFQASPTDQWRLDRYAHRLRQEKARRRGLQSQMIGVPAAVD